MYEHPGNLIGDAWYFAEGSVAHMYYLTWSNAIPPEERHHHWDIGHAVSTDLTNWQFAGIALSKGAPTDWDGGRLATGSVIRREGRYWMAYTGHRLGETPDFQRVGMAVSDDLCVWEKQPGNPVTEADGTHYERESSGRRPIPHWRDPFLLDTGSEVLHAVCARRMDGPADRRGTLGLARTNNMRDWELLPPVEHDRIAEEFEVPQLYAVGGRFYVVFCTHPDLLSAEFRARFPGHPFRSCDYSMVGESPLGPFRIHGTGEIVPPDWPEHLYASQLVQWQGDWYLLGTVMGADRISDPVPIVADETGVHAIR